MHTIIMCMVQVIINIKHINSAIQNLTFKLIDSSLNNTISIAATVFRTKGGLYKELPLYIGKILP